MLASSFFAIFSWIVEKEEKRSKNAENTKNFRKVQWQNHSKLAKISMKLCTVCLIGTNSETVDLEDSEFVFDWPPNSENSRFGRFGTPA